MALSGAYFLALMLEALLICRPIPASWEPHVHGSCGNVIAAYLTLEICGLVLDAGVLALILIPICKLKTELKKKTATGGMFLLGAL